MNTEQYSRVQSLMTELRQVMSRISTVEAVNMCAYIMRLSPAAVLEEYGLPSPARQSFYLLASLCSTPEPSGIQDAPEDSYKAISLVKDIYNAYPEMFRSAGGNSISASPDFEKVGAVMRAYLHYHNTLILATPEQILSRVEAVFLPFADKLADSCGIGPADVVAITRWIPTYMESRFDRFDELRRAVRTFVDKETKKGLSHDEALAAARARGLLDGLASFAGHLRHPLAITLDEIAAQFGSEKASAFWRLFVTRRGTVHFPVHVDDVNPVELAPLIAINEDAAIVVSGNHLAMSAWHRFVTAATKSEYHEAFFRRRDKVLEDQVLKAFQAFADDVGCEFYPSCFLSQDHHFEHDLIIVCGKFVFAIESKATPMDAPFRDVERSYLRIERAFRGSSGIQKAYTQARRIHDELVQKRAPLSLFDASGQRLVTLEPEQIEDVFCICVTADDYGALATDLSLLLEKDPKEPYPWAVNAYDLEAFLDAMRRRGWGMHELITYLTQRRELHGKILTTDELEIAGAFVKHGTLKTFIDADADRVIPGPELANIFDEIWEQTRGGPPAVFDPPGPLVMTDLRASFNADRTSDEPVKRSWNSSEAVGRNDPCPCGSGKKFKRCHLKGI